MEAPKETVGRSSRKLHKPDQQPLQALFLQFLYVLAKPHRARNFMIRTVFFFFFGGGVGGYLMLELW